MIARSLALALGACLGLSAPVMTMAQGKPTAAAELQLPAGSLELGRRETALGAYAMPIGAFSEARIPMRLVEGHVLRRTWQLRGDATALQVLDPLRQQLVAQGYEILFQCAARQCGGFDFRFGIEVVPAPDMVVNLSDYHFLAAARSQGGEADLPVASLLVSRSGSASYVQLIEVTEVEQAPLELTSTESVAPSVATSLDALLLQQGHAVLEGLVFNTGNAALGQDAIASLEKLAQFLEVQPQARVLIVGHTDTVGTLTNNVDLSLRRAGAVKDGLISGHGIDETRVEVAGAGYMAPIASNLTSAGRERNRRVEVVLISN